MAERVIREDKAPRGPGLVTDSPSLAAGSNGPLPPRDGGFPPDIEGVRLERPQERHEVPHHHHVPSRVGNKGICIVYAKQNVEHPKQRNVKKA